MNKKLKKKVWKLLEDYGYFQSRKQKGFEPEKAKEAVKKYFGLKSFKDLTMVQAMKAIDNLLKRPDADLNEVQA